MARNRPKISNRSQLQKARAKRDRLHKRVHCEISRQEAEVVVDREMFDRLEDLKAALAKAIAKVERLERCANQQNTIKPLPQNQLGSGGR
jgi:hypothetical protein